MCTLKFNNAPAVGHRTYHSDDSFVDCDVLPYPVCGMVVDGSLVLGPFGRVGVSADLISNSLVV